MENQGWFQKLSRMPVNEAQHQIYVFDWAQYQPVCKDYLFCIPNGGKRDPITAKSLQKQGVRPGVSDMFLAYPNNEYHGLWIELKKDTTCQATPLQKHWLDKMNKVGFKALVAYGFEDAIANIEEYLK